jgi:chromosome segregation ATPase
MSKRNNEEAANDADTEISNVEAANRILKGAEIDVTAARSDVDAAKNERKQWEMNHPNLLGIYKQNLEWQFLNQRLNEANQRLNDANQRLNDANQRLKDISSIYQRGTGRY